MKIGARVWTSLMQDAGIKASFEINESLIPNFVNKHNHINKL